MLLVVDVPKTPALRPAQIQFPGDRARFRHAALLMAELSEGSGPLFSFAASRLLALLTLEVGTKE